MSQRHLRCTGRPGGVSVTLKGAAYYKRANKRASRLVGKPEDKFMHFGSRALFRSYRARHVAARGGCLARHGQRQVPGETIPTGSAGSRPTPALRVSLLPGSSLSLSGSDQTAIARGEISFEMVLALTFSATRRSYAVCRFSQPCASLPK